MSQAQTVRDHSRGARCIVVEVDGACSACGGSHFLICEDSGDDDVIECRSCSVVMAWHHVVTAPKAKVYPFVAAKREAAAEAGQRRIAKRRA